MTTGGSGPPGDRANGWPLVSAIIPTRERPGEVSELVRQLRAQTYPHLEVVVVDQSARAVQLPTGEGLRLRYVWTDSRGASAARNIGRRHADGEILLFLDDDVDLLSHDFVEQHVARLRQNVSAVTGRVVELRTERRSHGPCGRVIPLLCVPSGNADADYDGPVDTVKGGNFAVWAAEFDRVGGFDESFGASCLYEETEFSLRLRRAGGTIVFVPQAAVVHKGVTTGGQRTETPLSRFRYLAFRDRCRVFFRTHNPLWLPVFVAGNVILAARPLFLGRTAGVEDAFRGLRDGLRLWREPRRLMRASDVLPSAR